MFESILRRAQVSVDITIAHLLGRVLVALPFLVAGGFATGALSLRLSRQLGPESANMVLAAIFCGIGLLTAIIVAARRSPSAPPSDHTAEALSSDSASVEEAERISTADRDLLLAALTSAAPIALPGLIRLILRNLPLLLAIIGAVFVMSQPTRADPVSSKL